MPWRGRGYPARSPPQRRLVRRGPRRGTRRPAEALSSLLRAWRRERVAWAGAAGTREATWRGRRVRRSRTCRAGRRRGCPAGGQIGRRRLTNETGWTGRTLRRDGSGPDRMAGPSQHAGHGGGAHDDRAAHGEPAPPAEAPAPRDDLADIHGLPGGPGWRLFHLERPPERVEIGHGSVTARHGCR
jgi:hypothetical protein